MHLKNQVRAHVANRIVSFRGGGDDAEPTTRMTTTAVDVQEGQSQGGDREQIGDLVQADHPVELGLVGVLESQDDIIPNGQSCQRGCPIGEKLTTGKNKATEPRAKSKSKSDSDLNRLHVTEPSSEDLSWSISGSGIICVQPASSD